MNLSSTTTYTKACTGRYKILWDLRAHAKTALLHPLMKQAPGVETRHCTSCRFHVPAICNTRCYLSKGTRMQLGICSQIPKHFVPACTTSIILKTIFSCILNAQVSPRLVAGRNSTLNTVYNTSVFIIWQHFMWCRKWKEIIRQFTPSKEHLYSKNRSLEN